MEGVNNSCQVNQSPDMLGMHTVKRMERAIVRNHLSVEIITADNETHIGELTVYLIFPIMSIMSVIPAIGYLK